jgi:hypothetical protein
MDGLVGQFAGYVRSLEDMRILQTVHIVRQAVDALGIPMLLQPNAVRLQCRLELLIRCSLIQGQEHMVIEVVLLFIQAHVTPVKRQLSESVPWRQGGIFQVEACILDAIHIIGLVLLGNQAHVETFGFELGTEHGRAV